MTHLHLFDCSQDAALPEGLAPWLASAQAPVAGDLVASEVSRRGLLRLLGALMNRMQGVTDVYELSRVILAELTATLGYDHALMAAVSEEGYLEVSASSRVIAPPYMIEQMENAFVIGEELEVTREDEEDWGSLGTSELPAGVRLTAMPLNGRNGVPVGALVLEGSPSADRAAWLPLVLELAADALAECQAYGRGDKLVMDAVLAIAADHAERVEGGTPQPIYLGRHLRRVEALALQIARVMQLSPSATKRVRVTALLHDMDRGEIARAFARVRRGQLTAAEWQASLDDPFAHRVYRSPLNDFQRLMDDLPALRWRWDGKGNRPPAAGGEIPLHARVVAVAEAFENLTGSRRHRTTLPIPAALEQLRRLAGAQYDPTVVATLCAIFQHVELESTIAHRPAV